ncbi:MAG: HK97 gp10 family phage protein [Euryarchaeota archaeon]|nr:HK97 gp10 family phage protein [Euryarchaeota archaeon]
MSRITPEVKAEVRNLKEEREKLRKLKEGFPSEVEKVLYQEAWRVMGISIKQAPIDTGRLRASARVDLPVREGNAISIRLSYNTDYAKYVHERNAGGFPVNYRAPGTKSMFLIDPLIENITEMERRISRRLERMVMQHDG